MDEMKNTLSKKARERIAAGKPLKEDLISSAEIVVASHHSSMGRSYYYRDANGQYKHGTASVCPSMLGLPLHAGFRYRVTFELLPPITPFDPDINTWQEQQAKRLKPYLKKKKDTAHAAAVRANESWQEFLRANRYFQKLHKYLQKLFNITSGI